MTQMKSCVCIVCGQPERPGERLIDGELGSYRFWFHRGECGATFDTIGHLVHAVWYPIKESFSITRPGEHIPRTVLLIGAGMSVPCGIPGYSDLLSHFSNIAGRSITTFDLSEWAREQSEDYRKLVVWFSELHQ